MERHEMFDGGDRVFALFIVSDLAGGDTEEHAQSYQAAGAQSPLSAHNRSSRNPLRHAQQHRVHPARMEFGILVQWR